MIYSFKDLPVYFNGDFFAANEADISVENQLNPLYLAQNKHASSYAPQGGINGSLRVNYFLTGQDPLKDFFSNELGSISGNLGGLYFNSGYLRSYSFTANPNAPVYVSAEILFYEQLKG